MGDHIISTIKRRVTLRGRHTRHSSDSSVNSITSSNASSADTASTSLPPPHSHHTSPSLIHNDTNGISHPLPALPLSASCPSSAPHSPPLTTPLLVHSAPITPPLDVVAQVPALATPSTLSMNPTAATAATMLAPRDQAWRTELVALARSYSPLVPTSSSAQSDELERVVCVLGDSGVGERQAFAAWRGYVESVYVRYGHGSSRM